MVVNRNNPEYKKRKTKFLRERELWPPGWWICENCGSYTQTPELDHVENVGMGGSPERLLNVKNFSLKCRECHQLKTEGKLITDN